jgi:hypothetical protein
MKQLLVAILELFIDQKRKAAERDVAVASQIKTLADRLEAVEGTSAQVDAELQALLAQAGAVVPTGGAEGSPFDPVPEVK